MSAPSLGDAPALSIADAWFHCVLARPHPSYAADPDTQLWHDLRSAWNSASRAGVAVVGGGGTEALGLTWASASFPPPEPEPAPTAPVPAVPPTPAPDAGDVASSSLRRLAHLASQADAEAALAQVVARIRRGTAGRGWDAVSAALRAEDGAGNGALTRQQFSDALLRLGVGLLDAETDVVFRRYEAAGGAGTVAVDVIASEVVGVSPPPPPPPPPLAAAPSPAAVVPASAAPPVDPVPPAAAAVTGATAAAAPTVSLEDVAEVVRRLSTSCGPKGQAVVAAALANFDDGVSGTLTHDGVSGTLTHDGLFNALRSLGCVHLQFVSVS